MEPSDPESEALRSNCLSAVKEATSTEPTPKGSPGPCLCTKRGFPSQFADIKELQASLCSTCANQKVNGVPIFFDCSPDQIEIFRQRGACLGALDSFGDSVIENYLSNYRSRHGMMPYWRVPLFFSVTAYLAQVDPLLLVHTRVPERFVAERVVTERVRSKEFVNLITETKGKIVAWLLSCVPISPLCNLILSYCAHYD